MNHPGLKIFAAWGGFFYILLFSIAWLFLMRIVPGHDPSADAAAIAGLYHEHHVGITLGCILLLFSCFFLSLYGAVLVKLMEKAEQGFGVLSLSTLIAVAMGVVITMLAAVFWGTAAFRPERAPELIQTLNDLAWLSFFSTAPPIFMMFASVALVALLGDKALPIFPRWYGYLNLWVLVAIIPGVLALLLKTGPFAWDGLIVYWMGAVTFVTTLAISPKVVVPAVKKHLI